MLDIVQDQARRSGLSQVDMQAMDAAALEFCAGYFDLIIAAHSLQPIPARS